MRRTLKTTTILGLLGATALLSAGAGEARAQLFRGRWGGYGPRGYSRGYYVPVYTPPVVVTPAPSPVVVTESRYVVSTPAVVRREVIQPAPVVETQVVQPPPVVERRVVQPPPVVERRVVQPPPVVETRVVQPPAVERRTVVQPAATVETDVVQPAAVVPPTPSPYRN